MTDVMAVYLGKSGDATKALYSELFARGPGGAIAVNLLRAAKNSRGGKNPRYSRRGRSAAYESKDWAMGELCRALRDGADALGIAWGWGFDEKAIGFEHVLYVELPGQGQVSFHTWQRRDGPDYAGEWDGVKDVSGPRCVRFAQFILNGGGEHVRQENGAEGAGAAGDAGAQVRPEERQEGLFD